MSSLVFALVIVGLVVLLILLFLYWNCRCRSEPICTPRRNRDREGELHGGPVPNRQQNAPPPSVHGPLSVRADESHGRQAQNGQQNAPPPSEHVIEIPPPPPPPAFINSSGGTGSSSSGPDNSLPPPSRGIALGFSLHTFTYQELARATDRFSYANLLGQGGFGYVHRGVLPNGKEIAVKQLKSGSGQGEREFRSEVETISRVHHRHLVSLVGYCISGEHRLLVYEFVPNKTLEFHLHEEGQPALELYIRLKIALGSAKGLAYLHDGCNPPIIHRDIKAANILLDTKFEPKVADFGLAKDFPDGKTHVSTKVKGTFGYLAPDYVDSSKLTDKSDVYSFGVMLLELITGRRPIGKQEPFNNNLRVALVNWAKDPLKHALKGNYERLVDPRLQKNYNRNQIKRMVACAAACVHETAEARPPMSLVVKVLEGDVPPENLNDGVPPMRTGRT